MPVNIEVIIIDFKIHHLNASHAQEGDYYEYLGSDLYLK